MRYENSEPYDDKCWICGQFGHWKLDCPDYSRNRIRNRTPPKRYSPYPSRRSHDEYQRDRSFRQQRSDPDRSRDHYHGRYERHERHEDRNYNRNERYDYERDELEESYEEYRREREDRKNKVKSAKKPKLDRSDVGTCLDRYVHYKDDEEVMSAGDTVKDKKTKKKNKRKISIIDEKPQSIVNVDFVMQILLEKVFGNAQEDERKSKSLILKKIDFGFLVQYCLGCRKNQ